MPKRIQILRRRAFERQHGLCCYCSIPMWCDAPSELQASIPSTKAARRLRCTAEHLQARSEGGADEFENIAAACAHCNHTRHKKKRPPRPDLFAAAVKRRVADRRWHSKWVYECGLL